MFVMQPLVFTKEIFFVTETLYFHPLLSLWQMKSSSAERSYNLLSLE